MKYGSDLRDKPTFYNWFLSKMLSMFNKKHFFKHCLQTSGYTNEENNFGPLLLISCKNNSKLIRELKHFFLFVCNFRVFFYTYISIE